MMAPDCVPHHADVSQTVAWPSSEDGSLVAGVVTTEAQFLVQKTGGSPQSSCLA